MCHGRGPESKTPLDAANILADLHRSHAHGREMLKKSKAILSGIFTLPRNLGALNQPNPIPGTMIPKKAAKSSDLHAASLDEVAAILDALGNARLEDDKEVSREYRLKARAAVALQFFAGLRPGEARGARWEDYDGKRLTICQSVWHTYTTTPKTEESAKSVPVIEPMASLREADGNPQAGRSFAGHRESLKHWRYAGHPFLSGEIESTRLDVPALQLVPLKLEDHGIWDPGEEYWGEPGEPIDDWARPIIARGPRPEFEMKQVVPGREPDDLDSDPITESNDLKDAGDARTGY